MLLFWVVNRSHPLCCSAFLGVQYSALYTQPLSDIIEKHSVLRHMFTDDTKFYNSTPRSSTDSLFCSMQNFVSDVKKWTIHNKLQLNEDKTEALLFEPSTSSDIPDVLDVGQSGKPFCDSARNLGVMFDNGLTMKQQVDRICQTECFEMRRIGSISQFLTTEATKTLVVYLALSRFGVLLFPVSWHPSKTREQSSACELAMLFVRSARLPGPNVLPPF